MARISEKFKLMKQDYNSEWFKSFMIPLPFSVENRMEFIKSICLRNGSNVLHVRVRKVSDGYTNKVRDDTSDAIKKADF